MAITWTKNWTGSDDGSILRAIDLRNIQLDLANVLQTSDLSVTVQAYSATLLALASSQNLNPANWVRNGAMDAFTGANPDNWTAGGGGTHAQETTIVRIGANSMKLTSDADGSFSTQTVVTTISATANAYLRSKVVTLTAQVYATEASVARIRVDDGITVTNSSYHTGTAGWEELSISPTIGPTATKLDVVMVVDGNTKIGYFDAVRLNMGSLKWQFTRHKGDSTNP